MKYIPNIEKRAVEQTLRGRIVSFVFFAELFTLLSGIVTEMIVPGTFRTATMTIHTSNLFFMSLGLGIVFGLAATAGRLSIAYMLGMRATKEETLWYIHYRKMDLKLAVASGVRDTANYKTEIAFLEQIVPKETIAI